MIDPYATVVGDGTTLASRSRARWRTARWPLAAALVVVLAAGVMVLVQPRTSSTPFAPDAVGAEGARAVARVLERQGVTVEHVTTSRAAVAAATPGSTLLVVEAYLLDDRQLDRIAGLDSDLVVLGALEYQVRRLTDDALTLRGLGGAAEAQPARCTDPDAVAAQTVTGDRLAVRARDGRAEVCFGDGVVGMVGVVDLDGRRVDVVDTPVITNGRVTEAGNAALALRLLGRHEHLVWYVPTFGGDEAETAAATSATAVLPAWSGPVGLVLLLTVAAAALWRGRALGRVVTEPLPVSVRAGETTRGRGRLYRRGRARGRAAASLRAATASRLASAVGLPRTAGRSELVDAVAHVSGRERPAVDALLYGVPPADDAALLALARALTDLEREVHP